jgi:hypothetical protein
MNPLQYENSSSLRAPSHFIAISMMQFRRIQRSYNSIIGHSILTLEFLRSRFYPVENRFVLSF